MPTGQANTQPIIRSTAHSFFEEGKSDEVSLYMPKFVDLTSKAASLLSCLNDATHRSSNLPLWVEEMAGMSGKTYRHFINRYVSMHEDTRYLEVGSWHGSTACAAAYGNDVSICCVDDWSLFEGSRTQFILNIGKAMTKRGNCKLIEADFRKVDFSTLGLFNIYMFDGPHSEQGQYDGITLAQPALENNFTLVVDDWNWEETRTGTLRAIQDLNLLVDASIEIRTTFNGEHPKPEHSREKSNWHNGYFIADCHKPHT